MTIYEIYNEMVLWLESSHIDQAQLEARFIIEDVLGLSYSDFLVKKDEKITDKQEQTIMDMVKERICGKPIQYILGKWEFFGEEFITNAGVLIPRPETEILVQKVLDEIKNLKNPVIFDLCSGSGCIGISIKNNRKDAKVILVEKSTEALKILRQNVEKFGFETEVEVIQGDILTLGAEFDKLPRPDIIVSNPPYIKSCDMLSLQKEVLQEPKMALDGGEDGYIFYEKLAELWLPMINQGAILIECGEEQAQTIEKMFARTCGQTQIVNDYNNIERIVIGRKTHVN